MKRIVILIGILSGTGCAKTLPSWKPVVVSPSEGSSAQPQLPLNPGLSAELKSVLADSFRLSLAGLATGQPLELAAGFSNDDIFFRFPSLLGTASAVSALKSSCTPKASTDSSGRMITDLTGDQCPVTYHDEFLNDPNGHYSYGSLDVEVKNASDTSLGDVTAIHAEASSTIPAAATLTTFLEIRETLESRLHGQVDLDIQLRQGNTPLQAQLTWTSSDLTAWLTEWTESPSARGYSIMGNGSGGDVTRDAFLALSPVDFLDPP